MRNQKIGVRTLGSDPAPPLILLGFQGVQYSLNEVVKRKLVRSNNPQDLKNIAEITGVSVDILRGKSGRGKMMDHGQGTLRLRQKHIG